MKYLSKLGERFYIGVNFKLILKLKNFKYRYKNMKGSKIQNIGL